MREAFRNFMLCRARTSLCNLYTFELHKFLSLHNIITMYTLSPRHHQGESRQHRKRKHTIFLPIFRPRLLVFKLHNEIPWRWIFLPFSSPWRAINYLTSFAFTFVLCSLFCRSRERDESFFGNF